MMNYLILMLMLTACGLQNGGDPEPFFDKDIPPSEAFDASYGAWNADGTQIAFQHDEPLGSTPDAGKLDQLWVYDTETGKRWKVMDGRVENIDWSPDGEWFAFHTFTNPEYLFKVRADGSELTRLTGGQSPNDLKYTNVARWSPDGSQLLFTIVAGEPRGISLMNPDGTDARIIIPYGVGGQWFPDGNKIIYANWDTTVEDDTQRRQLYIANKDGSNITKITNLSNSTYVSSPVFSPDGSQIAFTHTGENGRDEIFLMNVDGTEIKQMTSGQGLARRPEWHPDGRKILFTRIIPNVSERMYLLDVQTRQVEPVFPAK